MTVTVVGAYAFDNVGGTSVPDLSGNGWDLPLAGSAGAVVASGHTGGAFGKTGTAMPVFPAGLLAATETADRAVLFWAQNNLTTWWVRWQKDSINSGTWGILLTSGSMAVQARAAGTETLATRPTATSPGAAWHHYCARYRQSTGLIDLLRDGVQASQQTLPGGAGTLLSSGASRIDIGEWTTTGPAVDDLRFLSSWPTDAEVTTLMNTPVAAASTAKQVEFFHA